MVAVLLIMTLTIQLSHFEFISSDIPEQEANAQGHIL